MMAYKKLQGCHKVCLFFLITLHNFISLSYYPVSGKNPNNAEPKTIVILFHLYNLNLMDEFIERINNFINLNNTKNQYYIKINIPVASNLESFKMSNDYINFIQKTDNSQYNNISAPYHPFIITEKNHIILCQLQKYLIHNLNIKPENIQIIFSENRGVDIGGFLLLIDQLIKQKIKHDYIIKLHTKTKAQWRKKLLEILDINMQKIPPTYRCIYGCKSSLSPKNLPNTYFRIRPRVNQVLKFFNLPEKKFMGGNHCSGTMFIAGKEMTDFFSKYNRLKLYNMLNIGFPKKEGFLLEHGFEVFFGYLTEYLKLDTLYL